MQTMQLGTGATAVDFQAEEIIIRVPTPGEVVPHTKADASGGFLPQKQYAPEEVAGNRTFKNEGWQVHIPGTALKGYATTTATSVVSGDFSGSRAANLKVHHLQWPTTSGLRNVFGFASFIIKDTSTTDPTPIVPVTADNVADNIMAMWLGKIPDGSLALFIGTDGDTDDVKYTTNPLADSITWVSAVTYPHSGDHVWAGVYLPQFRKHVIWAVINQVAGLYAWKDTDTLPMTVSTLEPVVFTQDADLPGSIASVTTSEIAPTEFGQEGQGANNPPGTFGGNLDPGVWENLSNAASDDGTNYATYAMGTEDTDSVGSSGSWSGLTNYFLSGGYAAGIPRAARILGIAATINVKHTDSNSAFDVTFADAVLRVRGAGVGSGRSTGQDIGTTDEDVALGGSGDPWGAELTGADLDYLEVGQRFAILAEADNNGDNNGSIDLDQAAALVFTYQMPGVQVKPPQGGFGKGSPLLSFPNIVPIVEPVTDDATAINVPRRLAYYTFSADPNRLYCDVSYPFTGLRYVGVMSDHLGGLGVGGGANATTWDQAVLVGPDPSARDVENLELPATYGEADTVRLYSLFERDASSTLFGGIHHGDAANAQLWVNTGVGRWNAYGVLHSKGVTAIATAPIPFAMTNPTTHAYRFYPNSTTSLHVQYEFVDNDPQADNRLVNSTQNRHTGALRLQWAHLDMGRGDLLKTLVSMEVNSFEVDDGTSFGAVSIEVDVGEDLTMATPDVDQTFDAAAEVYTRRDVTSAGIQFDTAIIAAESGTTTGAKTPQILPFTLYYASQPEGMREIELRGVKPTGADDPQSLLRRLEILRRAKSDNQLYGAALIDEDATEGVPVMLTSMSMNEKVRQSDDRINPITLTFRETQGTSATA